MAASLITLEEFFRGHPDSRALFDVLQLVLEATGSYDLRVTKSQVSFRRRKAFAWAWIPARYLRGNTAPLVLSLSLPGRDPSRRWKEVVEPYPGRFIHHLELFAYDDINEEVRAWVKSAWLQAND